MKIVRITTALLFMFTFNSFAQQQFFKIPDSLKAKSIIYIKERLSNNSENKILDSIYSNSLLAKSKSSNNPRELIDAYKSVMYLSDKKHGSSIAIVFYKLLKNRRTMNY